MIFTKYPTTFPKIQQQNRTTTESFVNGEGVSRFVYRKAGEGTKRNKKLKSGQKSNKKSNKITTFRQVNLLNLVKIEIKLLN